jgi:hypothetical protein
VPHFWLYQQALTGVVKVKSVSHYTVIHVHGDPACDTYQSLPGVGMPVPAASLAVCSKYPVAANYRKRQRTFEHGERASWIFKSWQTQNWEM